MTDSRTLYATLLGITEPWGVELVEMRQEAGEVHVCVALPQRHWMFPECRAAARSTITELTGASRHLPVPRLRSMHAFRGSTWRAGSDMDRPSRMEMLRAGATLQGWTPALHERAPGQTAMACR